MNDTLVSIVRTLVPIAVGAVMAVLFVEDEVLVLHEVRRPPSRPFAQSEPG